MTVETINYVRIMSKFYNWMGVARVIFSIVLLVYQLRRVYLKFRLTYFQRVIIYMIQSLTLLQAVFAFWWNYRVFVNCEFWSAIIVGIIDINMFMIGILVTYYLYQAVNLIHQFAKKGVLPREQARQRMRRFIISLIVSSILVFVGYCTVNVYFHNIEELYILSYSDQGFGAMRALGMSISASLLSATIWKLKSAKVSKTDSGHLNLRDASVLLGLQVVMIISGIFSLWFFQTHTMA